MHPMRQEFADDTIPEHAGVSPRMIGELAGAMRSGRRFFDPCDGHPLPTLDAVVLCLMTHRRVVERPAAMVDGGVR